MIMKLSVKFTAMALVAMFAFSTPAEAQFGSLNALRKQIGIKTKKEKAQEKALEEAKRKQDSIQAAIDAITPTIPQSQAGAKQIVMKWRGKRVGVWDPEALKLIFDETYDAQGYEDQHITYTLDPKTGEWTNILGTVVGRMSNDGSLVTPNLGAITLDTKSGKVSKDGEVIGQVSKTSASCYGTSMGEFDSHVSPLLMAYAFHGTMLSEGQIVTFKELKEKRDAEEAAAAKARAEAAKKAAAERKNNPRYTVLYYNGKKCEIDANNRINDGSNGIGWINYMSTGVKITTFSAGNTVGWIQSNGNITNASGNSSVGEVRNGVIYLNGNLF